MSNLPGPNDWREGRRQAAREAIVRAAWTLVDEEGLAGLSLRDLARGAGITTPTVYAYFESKSSIYDAMFGQAASEFADRMAAPIDGDGPHQILAAPMRAASWSSVPVIRHGTNCSFNGHSPGSNHHRSRLRQRSVPWPIPRSCLPSTASPTNDTSTCGLR